MATKKETIQTNTKRPKMTLFLSYSTQDHHYKDEIKKTLSKLERDGKIKLWVDEKNLRAGEEFNDVIEAEIRKADIFLLLLSRDFWASDYIQRDELPLILERYRAKEAIIIPIVLKDIYDLTGYDELKGINGLPRDNSGDKRLKPISEFQPEYRAYNVILEEIKRVIESLDRDILPLITLCHYSLKTLNPYNGLEKIQLQEISSMDNKFDIKIIEYFDDDIQKERTLSFAFSENEKHSMINQFQNSQLFLKIKNRLKENKIVSRYEILNYMGMTQDILFPIPSKIKNIEHIIETEDITNLSNIIETSLSKKLLVYGSAGVGKTSTLSALKSKFSDGLVILFDSFGAGTYKDFGSQRHLKKKILIELINEIAIEIGLELLANKFDIYDLESKFVEYLKEASNKYGEKKVIIVIDAGDNNVDGAVHFGEEPYIPKLWNINLPSNCYLIMSARGGLRKDSLQAIDEVNELELKGFNLEASTKILSQVFPNIKDDIALKFHQKTKGIPRLEDYLLQQIKGEYKAFLSILDGDKIISLEHIFEDMWQQALNVIQPITREHLDELICLSRPAYLDNFVLASGLDEEEALKIIKTLDSGITIDKQNLIRFQDEDFERFISSKIDKEAIFEAHKRIASNLFSSIQSNSFASKNIAFHLDKADEYFRLIEITLDFNLSHISDRLERKEIHKDRVDRALNRAKNRQDYKNIFKLLFVFAEIVKSDESLNEFLENSPELLSIYTDEENAVNYYLNQFESLGSFSYSCAYLLCKKNSKKIEEFLKIGDAWIKENIERENNHFDIGQTTNDIAKKITTIYHIRGIKEALKSASSWRLWFLFKIIEELPKEFLLSISLDEQNKIYHQFEKKIHPFIQAQLLVLLHGVGNKPSKTMVYSVAKKLHRYISFNPKRSELLRANNSYIKRHDFNTIAIDFSKLALEYGVEQKIMMSVLEKAITESTYRLDSGNSLKNFDDNFFKIVVQAEVKNNFSSIETLQEEYKDKREEKETIEAILPYSKFYVQTLLYQKSFIEIKEEWDKLLEDAISHFYYNHHRHFMIVIQRYQLLSKILILSNADSAVFIKLVQNIKSSITQYNVIYFISPILLYGGYLDEAFELIDFEIDRIQKDPDSAGEKVDNFNTFAEIVRPYDKERARYYFELALEASAGLDDKFYDLYKLITSLGQYSLTTLSKDEKVELINRNTHIVESVQPYLYETHGAIVDMSVKFITQLDFSLALEVAHKWDSDVLEKLEDSLSKILPIAIQNNELSIDELFALRYLIKKSSIDDSFLAILESLKNDKIRLFKTLEKMILFIRKNLADDAQYILEQIEEWLKSNGFNQHKIRLELNQINSFYQKIKPLEQHDMIETEPMKDWEKFLEPYIENLPKNLKKIEKLIFRKYEDNCLFDEIRKRLHSNQKMAWLKEVCKFDYQKYIDELIICFDKWKYDSEIKENRDSLIRETIAKHSSTRWSTLDYLEAFSRYIPSQEINKLILENRLKILSSMDAREIYNLMNSTHKILDKENIKEIVFDVIDKVEKHFEPRDFNLSKNYNNQEALINFLWKLLGDPDRRIRWKAKHTVIELIKENHQYIDGFIDKLFSTDGFPFTDDLSFYVISARESLLSVFHRLSYEIKESLHPYISKFKEILFDDDFPHVLIRNIAKRIIFNLSPEKDEALMLANEPKSCLLENQGHGYGWNYGTRFRFDSTDTIPYWYKNMQNIFNLEMIKLLERAESWIIDKWGQNDSIRFKNGYWGDNSDYNLTSHRHGTLPIIEEPKHHLEYEAMFLVVGELIKNNSINKGYYGDDKYQDFLDDYFTNNDFWYNEFREIKPLEAFLYGVFDKNKNIEKYDKILGLDSSKLLLDASYDAYTKKYSETITVSSTLVLSKTSMALLSLLKEADHFDYYFPYTNDNYESQKYKEYNFYAWIDKKYIETGKDSKDPYLHRLSNEIFIPSEEFIEFFSLTANKYKNSYTKNNQEIVKIERWADEDNSNDYDPVPISTGSRMWFYLDSVLAYLKYKKMDMMIEVRISSHIKDKYDKKSVIYLLKQNGIIIRDGIEFDLREIINA